ncbi:Serine-protein kinase ATM [Orchesella cincta]|uniref:Serine/threonine-protein kinase ATM n=1 Tax=Orchesella cincta TaxID=48709 RepID=A0A1D2NG62_ORCCI|nr:Serine-protein kinase ATM [Orchesella cincta]
MDPLQRMIAEMKTATRITDRKNAAQSFINYLNNDEDDVCETLDFNSVNPEKKASDRMTWTRLFAEVRDYFVKETEKGTMTHLNKLFYFSVIDQVFTKATSNRPWLQWSKVYDFILTHLQKDRHAALYGPSLISMLERFLSIEFYGTVIDATAWIELTNIILKCYKKYEISTVSILRCLNHCIARGSLYGQVISTLRSKVVNFYTKILQDDKNAIRQDIIPYLQGLTTLCALNAFEFRSILCKLGEDVIPSILQISSFSDEEETALIDFLMVQYRLHMPCDVDMNSDSFYAYDPQNWKEILRSVYSYCIDKIEDTAYKRNSLNKTDLKVSEELIQLAANCTKQISSSAFTENEDSEEGDGVLQKKKMRYKSFDTIINDVSRRPVSEGVLVWTSYLSVVLSDFPELVGTRPNLSSLIQLGNSMFNTSFINRREFYVYFLSVLRAEKYLLSQDVVSSFSDSWNTVWDLCIKSLSVCEDKSAAMQLLRNILKEIRPANIMSLLNLYMNNSMPPMECSLLLLADCLALCSLPVQLNTYNFASQAVILDEEIAATSCPRQAIIAWLMNASNQCANGMESLIATLMCSLVDTKKGEVCNKTAVSEIRMPHFKFIMKHRLAERLADALDMGFKDLPTLTISSNAHNVQSKYKQFISKLNLYLNIANIIDKYSMWENEGFGLQPVVQKIFDLGMLKLNNFIHECFTSELVNHPQQIAAVIKSTRVFMSNKLTVKMQRLLSSKFNQPTLEHLKKVFRSNLARYVERSVNNPHEAAVLFSDEELPSRLRVLQMSNAVELELITKKDRDCEKASTESLHALIDYGMICNHPLEFFNEILKDLHMEPFLSANQFLFDACADVIFKVSTMLPATGLEEIVVSIVGLLQKCCRGFFQLPYCAEKLWTLFKDITRVVAPVDLPDRTHFMILVGTLYNFLKAESKVTSSVYLKAFECFSELAKHDPSLTWTEFIPRGSAPCWVLEELHLFLKNQSHLIRMCVADTICNTYQHADPFDYSGGISSSQESGPEVTVTNAYQDRRKSFLKTLYTALLNTFDIECGLSPDEIREESVNRTSLALSCLTRLIFAFPYLQKQSIMNVFVIVKVKCIDVVLAQRALQYSSSSSTKTMCCYLSYILSTSLKLKHTVEDLPYQFFGSDNLVSFLTKFRYEICVEYFEQDKMEDLRKFAARFNTSVQSLTQECYGMLMARLTPGLAIHQYGLQSRGGLDVATFNETHKRLISELGGKDATETLMMTCLGDVVLNLISLTFDPVIVNEWGCLEVKLTEPVPPHYPETTIETCLKFLQAASPHSNVSVIGYLAKSSARSIYKILLALTVRIHEAHNDLEKYWRLHQLSFFINLLLNEPQDVFSSMKEYVCNFVFNTYLRLLKTQDGNEMDCIRFQQVLILLITKLVERITEECTDEMIAYFNPVVRGIVSAVVKNPVLMDSAKRLLDFLMKTHSLTFVSCIASLEPFPSSDVAEFQEYDAIQQDKKYGNFRHDWPLQKELEMCLKEIESSAASCTKERLRFLKDLLAKGKRDLERMVRNLETKRFSEECDKDPLHHIIQMLIGVTLTSHDEEVILEASRCLGEIGPVDLSVLVLPTHTNQVKINTSNDALIGIIKIIFSYITSDDIRLVTAAGEVLRNLFEYEECADLAKSKLYDAKLFKILLPFRCFQVQRLKQSMERIDTNMLETKLGLNEMNEYIDFRSWITGLSAGIIACFKGKSSLVAHLLPLCELRVDFCEDVLPYIVYLCLLGGNPIVKRVVTGYFRNFFSKFTTHYNNAADVTRSFTPSSSGTVGTCIFMNKLALRSLLRVIQFLRRHPMPQAMKGSVKLTPWDSNFWLDLNYLDVAKVAQFCGAYLTSILYVEIAATEMDIRHGTQQHYDDGSDEESQEQLYSQGLSMYSRNRSEVSKIEKLLLKAYTSIGEADATYGCGSARFTDVESSMHHMEQSMDWHRLLVLANGSSFDPESCQEAHVALSLKQQGLFNVLWAFLKGTESGETESGSEDDITQVQYECGWRLTKWNMNADKPVYVKDAVEPTSHTAFQVCIYEGIQAGLGGDTQNQLKSIKNGFRSVQTDLRHATLESSENICPFLSRLQMLRVVEDFFEKDLSNEQSLNEFVNKWKQQDRIPASDFKYQEPILFLRNVLLREYNSGKPIRNLDPEISESLLELISKARDAGRLDFADNLATAMASICKTSVQREFEVAKTNWARGKGDVARHILSRLIRKCNHEDDIFPSLLLLYGDWVSISHSERPSVILEKYLQRSCNLYEKKANAPLQEVSKANFVLAKYADAQYQNVSKYIGSEVFTAKQNHLQQARMEEEKMKHLMDLDSRRSAQIIRKQSSYDDEEINYIYKQRTEFLMLALRHYLRGLKASHEQDLLIFRAISLWLENGNDTDEKLVQQTTQIFGEETMPTYKYIVVLHQLSARLSNKSSKMNDLLKGILVKCAEEHPYHTLPVILTQASLHKDENLPKKTSNMKVQLTGRVKAAHDIVESLKANKRLKTLLVKMETVWVALIELANTVEAKRNSEGVKKNIPESIFKKFVHLEDVAVPTSTIPVLPSGNYTGSVVGIHQFGNAYGLVGGINSPKKIDCRGTNGLVYNMLLKGQDDLRQDAVMQQVFGVINKLLQAEPKTRARQLHIRTYKVIPLSQRTGLIEWVENTQTLGDYLVGPTTEPESGAHPRYRPNDYKPIQCRHLLLEARNCGDIEKKFSTYIQICEHFKPVFRHFFFENFKEAGVFFEKRLAYTRSVATNSIVGYILGLGDRHVLNILIDKTTAEFIHIDLGVAFEQGRILPTPETIPFRLTRDVIDGMGVCGIEGVFKKSCEMTMEVLRNNAEIILTVLQVLLYDPLYMWALTNDRVAKVQPSDTSKGGRKSRTSVEPVEDSVKERNNSAARVLLRLRQKLMGIEEEGGATGAISSGSSLSIDGHVSLLIQRAMDPEKLSRLFPGWQPYL